MCAEARKRRRCNVDVWRWRARASEPRLAAMSRHAIGDGGPSAIDTARRVFLSGAATFGLTVGGAGALAAGATRPPGGKTKEKKEKEEEVGPGEDLMREHGVLRRVLLVYGEASRRIETSRDLDPSLLQRSARLIRRFIEDYHEKQEEEMVFPRFERAGKLTDLVAVLRAQHQAGRKVTEQIQGLATAAGIKDPDRRRQLRGALAAF